MIDPIMIIFLVLSTVFVWKFLEYFDDNFDEIAEGKEKWVPVISEFYKPFHKNIANKVKTVKKEDFQEKLDKAKAEKK